MQARFFVLMTVGNELCSQMNHKIGRTAMTRMLNLRNILELVTEKRRVVEVTRKMTRGAWNQAERLLARSRGGSMLNTAFIERLNGTMRERLATLTRKC